MVYVEKSKEPIVGILKLLRWFNNIPGYKIKDNCISKNQKSVTYKNIQWKTEWIVKYLKKIQQNIEDIYRGFYIFYTVLKDIKDLISENICFRTKRHCYKM